MQPVGVRLGVVVAHRHAGKIEVFAVDEPAGKTRRLFYAQPFRGDVLAFFEKQHLRARAHGSPPRRGLAETVRGENGGFVGNDAAERFLAAVRLIVCGERAADDADVLRPEGV